MKFTQGRKREGPLTSREAISAPLMHCLLSKQKFIVWSAEKLANHIKLFRKFISLRVSVVLSTYKQSMYGQATFMMGAVQYVKYVPWRIWIYIFRFLANLHKIKKLWVEIASLRLSSHSTAYKYDIYVYMNLEYIH